MPEFRPNHTDCEYWAVVTNTFNLYKGSRHEEQFAAGDEITAADSLRAFFEQHFQDSRDTYVLAAFTVGFLLTVLSGFRQHALLQHSRMHYMREEFAEARRVSHFGAYMVTAANII